ncbi:MAG: DUF2330 domain-containing protein [Myxococcaceae bacterium]|nr:DUF2330 domain-containing protein [Myxococcaceae bacterium]
MRLLFAAAAVLASTTASAFCGFYVAGGGAELFNNATQVVLMRSGTRTVLSMQNNYQGPAEDFAMVVPVPVVLQKENVKTLNKAIFDKVDKLSAPRLVEYWEQDPCYVPPEPRYDRRRVKSMARPMAELEDAMPAERDYGVKIEAKFEVGEYEIVILSAKDALGLDRYLRDSKYKIPQGAEPLFRPYIQQGMKFFVAKVNVKKVTFVDGQAKLSPLRFHYDSERFELPVRLGLINAKDKQDLIVHILARNQRFESANYPNVTIPTNIDLVPSTKSEFGPFYASLFDKTLAKAPKAVVTEYSWDSSTCDPCPIPALDETDLTTLGLDVLDSGKFVAPEIEVKNMDKLDPQDQQTVTYSLNQLQSQIRQRHSGGQGAWGFVLTRLHARYDKSSLGEDLVFKAAPGIAGGREFLTNGTSLEQGAVASGNNQFQGRYAIRYPWTGPIACKNPVRGRWGANPNGGQAPPLAAQDTAFAPRGKDLATFAESPVSELGVSGKKQRAGQPANLKN